jgi:hypothetical protein
MAYSKIERQTRNDERFRGWSRTRRDVWLYLLCNSHMDKMGGRLGCYVLDPLYAAADLNCPDWQPSPAEIESEFRALHDEHRIVWDPSVRLVLLRHYLRHNAPENPNVAKAAAADIGTLPYSEPVLRGLIETVRELLPERFEKGQPCGSAIIAAAEARLNSPGRQNGSGNGRSKQDNNLNSFGTVAPTVTQTLPERYAKPWPNPEPEPLPEPEPEPTAPASPARTPEAEPGPSPPPPAAAAAGAVEGFASEVVQLANRGMIDNPLLADFRPLANGARSRQAVADWLGLGAAEDVIRLAIYESALRFQPDEDSPQINSLAYFTAAVKRRLERKRAGKAEPPPAGSESAAVLNGGRGAEEPGTGRSKASSPAWLAETPQEKQLRQWEEQDRLVKRWADQHKAEFDQLVSDVTAKLEADPAWSGTHDMIRRAKVRAMVRDQVLPKLNPPAAGAA